MTPGRPPDEIEPVETYDPDLDPAVLRRRRELVLTFTAISVILAGCFILAFYMLRTKPLTRQQIVLAAQETVLEATGRNPTTQFGDPFSVEDEDDDLYLVRGELGLINAEGIPVHFWFDCLLRRSETGELVRSQLKLTIE